MGSRCLFLHFDMTPHIVTSAARRSALAVLVGFWLTLVIWIPPPNQELVSQAVQEKVYPPDDGSEIRAVKSVHGKETQRAGSSTVFLKEHGGEIVRLQRRALPFINDPLQSVEDKIPIFSSLRFKQLQNAQEQRKVKPQQDQENVAGRLDGFKLREEKRNSLRDQISTTKMLINKEHAEVSNFQRQSKHSFKSPSHDSSQNLFSDLLDKVFISVKTTKVNHRTRCPPILQTWFQLARNQTFFFTDTPDNEIMRASGGHLVVTGCPSGHTRRALSCKMNSEFDAFAGTDRSEKKWWCHFDDDNYVNIATLLKVLSRYDPSRMWYLGRNSIVKPIDLKTKDWGPVRFRFATGGAGFCVSRALADALAPHALNGRLATLSDRIRLPDDVTMGFLVEVIVGKKLTVVREFHSHLEELRLLGNSLENQISLSYAEKRHNFVPLENRFPNDPTSFISVHCRLFPSETLCARLRTKYSGQLGTE